MLRHSLVRTKYCTQQVSSERPRPAVLPNASICHWTPEATDADILIQDYRFCHCPPGHACSLIWQMARSSGVFFEANPTQLICALAEALPLHHNKTETPASVSKGLFLALIRHAAPRTTRPHTALSLPQILRTPYRCPPRVISVDAVEYNQRTNHELNPLVRTPALLETTLTLSTRPGVVSYRLLSVQDGTSDYELVFGPPPPVRDPSDPDYHFFPVHTFVETFSENDVPLRYTANWLLSVRVAELPGIDRAGEHGLKTYPMAARPPVTPHGLRYLQFKRPVVSPDLTNAYLYGATWVNLLFFGGPDSSVPYVPLRGNCPHTHNHFEQSLGNFYLRSPYPMLRRFYSCLTLHAMQLRSLPRLPDLHVVQYEMICALARRNNSFPSVAVEHANNPFCLPHPYGVGLYCTPGRPFDFRRLDDDMLETIIEFSGGEVPNSVEILRPQSFSTDLGSILLEVVSDGRLVSTLLSDYHYVQCPCCGQEAAVPRFLTQDVVNALYNLPPTRVPRSYPKGFSEFQENIRSFPVTNSLQVPFWVQMMDADEENSSEDE